MKRHILILVPLVVAACSDVPSQTATDAGGDRDAATPVADGSYALPDAGSIRVDRFVTDVVDFAPGDCAGFGLNQMPKVVQGPPRGFGDAQGAIDVLSLGKGGSIVLAFGQNAILDGPGPDFVVFENAFKYGADLIYAEPGEVSVSDDGKTWATFPCTATAAPYGSCAGWHPVYSSPGEAISPVDYPACGGDAFDLADVGTKRARFVRIRDTGTGECPSNPKDKTTTVGFDLDGVAILNAAIP